jgi:hypothetical protein
MLSRSPFPTGFIEPCLPTLAHAVPDGSRWAFEVKHDRVVVLDASASIAVAVVLS